MERTHFGQHGPDCFGCRVRTVQFGNVEAPPQRNMELQWARDLPAYKRLRTQGLQPPRTQGAAELEARAHTKREVEMGRIIAPRAWREVGAMIEDAEAVAGEGQFSVEDVREWKKARSATAP
jgi:hypothetical protein